MADSANETLEIAYVEIHHDLVVYLFIYFFCVECGW